jgi:hypothetical protein
VHPLLIIDNKKISIYLESKMKITFNSIGLAIASLVSLNVNISAAIALASGDDNTICALSGLSECWLTISGNQIGNTVVFKFSSPKADFFNIRYKNINGGDTQKENRSGSFTFRNVLPNRRYTIGIQHCKSNFLASSNCSDWATHSVTTQNVEAMNPNTCKQGYVWREADATDRVCVTPAVRTQTRNENSLAAQRREPNGGAYGPNTCKQGFVWREAVANDVVCVPPAVRTQAAEDNKQAGERRVY